jgi:iron complex outermembrane receptor protein
MNVDLSYGRVTTTNITQALTDRFDLIQPDNAFIQQNPGLAAATAFGPAFFNKDWTSQVDSYSTFHTKVKRAVIGFNGQYGDSTWSWQGYYQYGKTDREQLVWDNRHSNAYLMAVDSIIDPATGDPICRVALETRRLGGDPKDPNDPLLAAGVAAAAAVSRAYATADPRIAAGCVPLNPFGTQVISTAARNYAFGYLDEVLGYKQRVAAFDSSGDIWEGLGAGPFQLAAGLELRREVGHNIDSENDANTGQPVPLYVHSDYLINYGETFAGEVDVSEAFVELNTPLLDGKPAAKRLEFNSAVRTSRYENTGLEGTTGETRTHDFTTWKISGLWDPTGWLRVRGSRSRDSRAANFRELYYEQQLRAGGIFGYCGPSGTTQKDACDWSLEGNVDLKPEKADTTTYGLVLTPQERAQGLQFAADYFEIEIDDAIQQANVRRVLDGCQISRLAEFCSLIVPDDANDPYATYDPNGNGSNGSGVKSIRALAFNGSGYSYKGIDFTGNYVLDLGGESRMNFRLLATHMLEQKFEATPGAPFVDIVGQTGGANSFLSDNQPTADWVANFATTWEHRNINITGQVRYVSSGVMNYFGITPGEPGYETAQPPLVTQSDNNVPA